MDDAFPRFEFTLTRAIISRVFSGKTAPTLFVSANLQYIMDKLLTRPWHMAYFEVRYNYSSLPLRSTWLERLFHNFLPSPILHRQLVPKTIGPHDAFR